MILYTENHTYKYESEKICRIYFPAEKIIFAADKEVLPPDSKSVYTEIKRTENEVNFICKAIFGKEKNGNILTYKNEAELSPSDEEKYLAKAMLKTLTDLTGITPPWGILTGVRPSKLMRNYISEMGEIEAKQKFTGFLEVSQEKTELAFNVVKAEEKSILQSKPNSYSLYLSIPFCPSRCSYCSFVSHSVAQAKKLIPDYIRLLCEEIKITAQTAANANLQLETVYIGGGTPTSLSAEALYKITKALNENFPVSSAKEFTVEAGRPDTIDSEKLSVLKNAGVTRISINPQTFSDEVLKNIGRQHTAAEAEEKFFLARKIGFDNINMDFIAGLPGDSAESFSRSINKAISLSPENITVHTLALKRSSEIVTEKEEDTVSLPTQDMLFFANNALYKSGYIPYYMYRQSKSVGNLENVGWSKENTECLYNIYMMEEIHTVLALGAGAVSKLKAPLGNEIERIYNFKYPYEYISRFKEQLERKNRIGEFYKAYSY